MISVRRDDNFPHCRPPIKGGFVIGHIAILDHQAAYRCFALMVHAMQFFDKKLEPTKKHFFDKITYHHSLAGGCHFACHVREVMMHVHVGLANDGKNGRRCGAQHCA